MIGVVGIASIRSCYSKIENNTIVENDSATIKILKSNTTIIDGENYTDCEVKFLIRMQTNIECKSLDDYVGHVYPFLKNLIKGTITRVQIIKIIDLGPAPLKHLSQI
ncbi:hypothetical protein [Lysinibacillus sp. NPDC056232]|uniref:hypothetical protein n=1 Tax=Lysinibacillus sp. NPDC056232 TaxID=3345756 RepID=UPI0035D82B56